MFLIFVKIGHLLSSVTFSKAQLEVDCKSVGEWVELRVPFQCFIQSVVLAQASSVSRCLPSEFSFLALTSNSVICKILKSLKVPSLPEFLTPPVLLRTALLTSVHLRPNVCNQCFSVYRADTSGSLSDFLITKPCVRACARARARVCVLAIAGSLLFWINFRNDFTSLHNTVIHIIILTNSKVSRSYVLKFSPYHAVNTPSRLYKPVS
jgi:hypothetical protein